MLGGGGGRKTPPPVLIGLTIQFKGVVLGDALDQILVGDVPSRLLDVWPLSPNVEMCKCGACA